MQTTFKYQNILKKIHTNIPALAYMDDTLWIAQSQKELQNILKTATSFFHLTNIKVNPSKSILSVTNSHNTEPSISFNNTLIRAVQPKEAFRILGCWYTTHKNHKPIYTKIKEEAIQAIKRITQARITDKQATYITNTVILTHIAYRIQNTYLSLAICKKLTKQYTTAIKHKAGFARTSPNSTFFHHQIYGIRTIENIQTQQHISTIH